MAAERARTWQPGEVVLGLYEVLDVVHSGGMGLVHRVRHRDWQVDLAVKTPRPEQVRTKQSGLHKANQAHEYKNYSQNLANRLCHSSLAPL